jgi:glycosyltransferase involved in cell wall biosynthesis
MVVVGNLPDPIGGVAEYSYQICAQLADRGVDVQFFDTEIGGRKRLPPLAGYAPLTGHYLRGLLSAMSRPRLVRAWAGVVRPIARTLSISHLLRSLAMAGRIERVARRSHATLIVAQHAGARALAALIAARCTGSKLTVLVHGAEWTHDGWRPFASRTALIAREADHVIANSQYTATLCRENTGRPFVDVIHPGVDHAVYTARDWPSQAPGSDAKEPTVLFVGELHPRKGADVFAAAIDLLPAELPACFVFAGPGGSLEPTVRDVLTRSKRSQDIRWLGPIAPGDLADVYRSADIVVFPTVWATEGFGMVAAEAMACAVPVIASRIGAIPEVVSDGHTGLLFAPGDATDLAEKIRLLLADPPRRIALGRRGAEVAAAYEWSHVASALLAQADTG